VGYNFTNNVWLGSWLEEVWYKKYGTFLALNKHHFVPMKHIIFPGDELLNGVDMSGWSLLIGMRPWLMSGFVTPFGNDFHIAMVYITIKSDDLPMKHFMIFPIAMFFSVQRVCTV